MTDALFDMGSPTDKPAQAGSPPQEIPIKDHQIQQIRDQLDAAGIAPQKDRQKTIQAYVSHPISSLRDLTAAEAHEAIKRLRNQQKNAGPKTGSAWDQREEDTWIDKL